MTPPWMRKRKSHATESMTRVCTRVKRKLRGLDYCICRQVTTWCQQLFFKTRGPRNSQRRVMAAKVANTCARMERMCHAIIVTILRCDRDFVNLISKVKARSYRACNGLLRLFAFRCISQVLFSQLQGRFASAATGKIISLPLSAVAVPLCKESARQSRGAT